MTFRTSAKSFAFGLAGVVGAVGCSSNSGEENPLSKTSALQSPAIVVENNETQPVYSYEAAIREVIYVEAPIDSDADGKPDLIALDVMRPKETDEGLKAATVMEASPYYSDAPSALRANRSLDGRQVPGASAPRGFGRWYDEFFVPRGYAVVEVEMQGTARSKGCPTTGGKEDTASIKASIDWLNGRVKGYHADGTEAVASWSTGSVGMLGVSYNGTLPIAVASTGVEGLKTIVPIAAISSWYDYTRDQGIGYANGWDKRYPEWLAKYVISSSQESVCAAAVARLGDNASDDTFDYTPFWEERDYRKNIDNVKAAVFAVHGLEDWNVKTRHFGKFWSLIQERNIPRKVWLHANAHVDPVSLRPDEWKKAMHHWMDHWLYGIENGVMEEPMATIQRPGNVWETYAGWPEPGTHDVSLYFGPAGEGLTGTLQSTPETSTATQSLTNSSSQTETAIVTKPEEVRAYRLAYAGPVLANPVRISGTVRVRAAVTSDTASTPVTALLVDYGESTSAAPLDFSYGELMAMPCSLADLANKTGCAAPKQDVMVTTSARIVSKGAIDLKNRESIVTASAVTPGESYQVEWEMHPKDWIFPAGHRIGVVVTANDYQYVSVDAQAGKVDVTLQGSSVILPVASGLE
ncbi:Xaa-Pro dipeptidyl-peptidase [Pendulispora rubella]|uniref:Xaa-Pro dipeptidyl-peptidase n=1 Tax=Pendulispora rubella TaxID=2741070 RepID=A0ABZ2L8B3_9BACT